MPWWHLGCLADQLFFMHDLAHHATGCFMTRPLLLSLIWNAKTLLRMHAFAWCMPRPCPDDSACVPKCYKIGKYNIGVLQVRSKLCTPSLKSFFGLRDASNAIGQVSVLTQTRIQKAWVASGWQFNIETWPCLRARFCSAVELCCIGSLCIVLRCIALFCIVLLCIALHLLCFALHCFELLCGAMFCIALLCIALFALLCCDALHCFCFALLCTVVHYFALRCFALLCFASLGFALPCTAFVLHV